MSGQQLAVQPAADEEPLKASEQGRDMARPQMSFSLSNLLDSYDRVFVMGRGPGWVLEETQRVTRGSCPGGAPRHM